MTIKLLYRSCDGYRARKSFKSLKGAQNYAHKMIGEHPEIGSHYAVSGDGIGTIRGLEGCTFADLFPTDEPEGDTDGPQPGDRDPYYGDGFGCTGEPD